jgi:hypothetical protein
MFSISSSSCCCVRFWVPCLCISPHCQPLPLPCAYLEGKVLEEVRGAVGLVRLCAAARIDPHADGRRLGPWGVLGCDLRHRVNCSPYSSSCIQRTVKPFFSVVDSVFAP